MMGLDYNRGCAVRPMGAKSEAKECGHWSKLTSLPHPAWFRELA